MKATYGFYFGEIATRPLSDLTGVYVEVLGFPSAIARILTEKDKATITKAVDLFESDDIAVRAKTEKLLVGLSRNMDVRNHLQAELKKREAAGNAHSEVLGRLQQILLMSSRFSQDSTKSEVRVVK